MIPQRLKFFKALALIALNMLLQTVKTHSNIYAREPAINPYCQWPTLSVMCTVSSSYWESSALDFDVYVDIWASQPEKPPNQRKYLTYPNTETSGHWHKHKRDLCCLAFRQCHMILSCPMAKGSGLETVWAGRGAWIWFYIPSQACRSSFNLDFDFTSYPLTWLCWVFKFNPAFRKRSPRSDCYCHSSDVILQANKH